MTENTPRPSMALRSIPREGWMATLELEMTRDENGVPLERKRSKRSVDFGSVISPPRLLPLRKEPETSTQQDTACVTSAHQWRLDQQKFCTENKIYRIYVCLLTALAVDQPPDARQYLKEKIVELRLKGIVAWDVLVHPSRRPLKPVVPYWLAREDLWDDYKPTKEQAEWAKEFNRRRLLTLGLRGCMDGLRSRKQVMVECTRRLMVATAQRRGVVLTRILEAWKSWSANQILARQKAFADLENRTVTSLMSNVFQAWRSHVKKTIETRKWFEKMSALDLEDDSNAHGKDYFSKLDWKCRIQIFQHLGVKDLCRCALVCRTWLDVTLDHTLWSIVDYSDLGVCMTNEVLMRLADRYRPTVTNLNLKDCNHLSYGGFSHLRECKNLQEVNLAGCRNIFDSGIRDLLEGCTNLMFLNVSTCRLSDLSLHYLATYGHSLEYLSLAYCEEVTDAGALSIASGSGCRNLVHLNLSGCYNFSSEGLVHLLDAIGPSLKSLILQDLSMMRNVVIFAVSKACKNLNSIDLSGCSTIDNQGLRSMERCSLLESLVLTENRLISGMGLKSCLRSLKCLSSLDFSGCANISTDGFACLGPVALTSLNLSRCSGLTDNGVIKFIESGSALRKNLTELDISECYGVTVAGYSQIGCRLTSLKSLSMRNCPGLDDSCFETIGDLKLETLDLSGCANFGANGMKSFGAIPHKELKHINLTSCTGVNDAAIQGLSSGCSGLLSIRLAGCTEITDEALYHLTTSNRHLHVMDLQGCHLITDKAIHCLGGIPNLAMLNIFGVHQVTGSTVERYLGKLRKLEFLALTDGSGISLGTVQNLKKKIGSRLQIHFDTVPPVF